MRHDITISGYGYGLRPIDIPDAQLIVDLRSAEERSRYLHRIAPDVKVQRQWLENYLGRAGDYYFVVVRLANGKPEGLIGLYDIDTAGGSGEWGRWILRPGSLAAPESVLLIYQVAFDVLGLQEVFCRTVSDNLSVLSFHDSCGLERRMTHRAYGKLDGKKAFDAVEHALKRNRWPAIRVFLAQRSQRIAARLVGPKEPRAEVESNGRSRIDK